MKIAHICPFYTPAIGGVKQVVEELAKRQYAQGHDVHVFTSDWDKYKRIKVKEETIDNIKIHRCYHYFKVANFGSFWPSVFTKLLKYKFDVIHIHIPGHPHTFLATIAAKLQGAKLIQTTHCPWSDAPRSFIGNLLLPFMYNIPTRISFMLSDKIIAITPWEYKFIKKYGGKRIINIPNGMSNNFFKKYKNNEFKNKYKKKKYLVLFFGRLSITKRPDNFVRIAKEILKERKDIQFILVGPDEGMKSLIKKMIKGTEIQLLEPIRDQQLIAQMYQSSDVYVLPSYREGLPLTLFEAMASGLPIVTSPVNGIPYEIKGNINGYLIDYRNIQKYKEKILFLLDNPKEKARIIKNNLKKAKDYNWDLINERYLETYKNN